MTFGEIVSDARRRTGISQKELAALIKKEDGSAISATYLNDIEHDRRSPSSERMIDQLAKILDVAPELLYLAAGRIPSDLVDAAAGEKQAVSAFDAFRKALRGKK